MPEPLCGAQVLIDPDPLDRTEQSCGVFLPAIFPGVCIMDLLADAHLRAHAVVPSNVLLLVAPARRPMFRQPEFREPCRGPCERIFEWAVRVESRGAASSSSAPPSAHRSSWRPR